MKKTQSPPARRRSAPAGSGHGRVIMVGEVNPRGGEALSPVPTSGTGGRLLRILDMTHGDYIDSFTRMNLCEGRWDSQDASRSAERIIRLRPDAFVLLGSKVAKAFGFYYDPFTVAYLGGRTFAILPHPSGRCRIWNDVSAAPKARTMMRIIGVPSAIRGE